MEVQIADVQSEIAGYREQLSEKLRELGAGLPTGTPERQEYDEARSAYLNFRAQVTRHRETQGLKRGEIKAAEDAIEAAQGRRDEAQNEVNSAQSALADAEEQLDQMDEDDPGRAALQTCRDQARRELALAERKLDRAVDDIARFTEQRRQLQAQLDEEIRLEGVAQQSADRALARMDQALGRPSGYTEEQIASIEQLISAAEARLSNLQSELASIDGEIAAMREAEARRLTEEQDRHSGVLPEEFENASMGGPATRLSDLDGGVGSDDLADGINCLEASTEYALQNGQRVLLLRDSTIDEQAEEALGEPTHHAVVVNPDGLVTFDGYHRVVPPQPVDEYLAASGYSRFEHVGTDGLPDGTYVGPVDPAVLTDPAMRQAAFQPGGALAGVPPEARFSDLQVQVPAQLDPAIPRSSENVPTVQPPVQAVSLQDLDPILRQQLEAAWALADLLGLPAGFTLEGGRVFVSETGQLMMLVDSDGDGQPDQSVPYDRTASSALAVFDGVNMTEPAAVNAAVQTAAASANPPVEILDVTRPLTAEQIEAYRRMGYTVVVADQATWQTATTSAANPSDETAAALGTAQGSAPLYFLVGGPNVPRDRAQIGEGTANLLWSGEASQEDVGIFVRYVNTRDYADPANDARLLAIIQNVSDYDSLEAAWAAVMEIEALESGTTVVSDDGVHGAGAVTEWWEPPESVGTHYNVPWAPGTRIDSNGGRVELPAEYLENGLIYAADGQVGYRYYNMDTDEYIYIFGARQIVLNQGDSRTVNTYWRSTDLPGAPDFAYEGGLVQSVQRDTSGNLMREVTLVSLPEVRNSFQSQDWDGPRITFTDVWYGLDDQGQQVVVGAYVYRFNSGVDPMDASTRLLLGAGGLTIQDTREWAAQLRPLLGPSINDGSLQYIIDGQDLAVTPDGAVYYRLPGTEQWQLAVTGTDLTVLAVQQAEAELGPIDLENLTPFQAERIAFYLLEGENWFDLGLSPAQIARRDELIAGQRAGTLTEAEHEELNILLMLAA
ncbi:MAG: hypothetical protein AB1758_05615, partial [Candidatus Eremiobacterota bacterium]